MYKSAKSFSNLFNSLTFFTDDSLFTLILQGISGPPFTNGERRYFVDVNSAVMEVPRSNKNLQIRETSRER